jgi:hypothetical protein
MADELGRGLTSTPPNALRLNGFCRAWSCAAPFKKSVRRLASWSLSYWKCDIVCALKSYFGEYSYESIVTLRCGSSCRGHVNCTRECRWRLRRWLPNKL